jgi:hypothetical protein
MGRWVAWGIDLAGAQQEVAVPGRLWDVYPMSMGRLWDAAAPDEGGN